MNGLDICGGHIPQALKVFQSHFDLVKEQNRKRGVASWEDKAYRDGALRLVLTDEVVLFVDNESSMNSVWVADDEAIIERLKQRYLKAECIEINILSFEDARQLDDETLATFMTRLQTLARNAFPKNPQKILRERAVWNGGSFQG